MSRRRRDCAKAPTPSRPYASKTVYRKIGRNKQEKLQVSLLGRMGRPSARITPRRDTGRRVQVRGRAASGLTLHPSTDPLSTWPGRPPGSGLWPARYYRFCRTRQQSCPRGRRRTAGAKGVTSLGGRTANACSGGAPSGGAVAEPRDACGDGAAVVGAWAVAVASPRDACGGGAAAVGAWAAAVASPRDVCCGG